MNDAATRSHISTNVFPVLVSEDECSLSRIATQNKEPRTITSAVASLRPLRIWFPKTQD